MKLLLAISLICFGFSFGVHADESSNNFSFEEPKPIKRASPKYPLGERQKQNSGMVELAFMVDTTGKVFEPMVLSSSSSAFEEEAIKAVEKYQYSAAMLNGQAVESRHEIRILFIMANAQDGVSKRFRRDLHFIEKSLLEEPIDNEKIDRRFVRMENSHLLLSPYALGYLNIAKLKYAMALDNRPAQIKAIERVLLFEGHTGRKGKFLEESVRIMLKRSLVKLLIQENKFGGALRAFNELKEIDEEAEQIFETAIEEIYSLLNSDRAVDVSLEIEERGYASTYLFKNIFYFDDVQGDIDEIKLRCRNKFTALEYNSESEYRIPMSWGKCHLQVIGSPNSTMKLIQY